MPRGCHPIREPPDMADVRDVSNVMSVGEIPLPKKTPRLLTVTSRELIKNCFEETTPISLPLGQPAIVLNETQIGSILRVVADKSSRVSFDMLQTVIMKMT